MIVVTGSVTARADSFDEVRGTEPRARPSLAHRARLHFPRRACRLRKSAAAGVFRAMGRSRRAAGAFRGPRLARFRPARCSRSRTRHHHRTVRRYQAGEIVRVHGCIAMPKFILQCNIRAPRYLRNQMRGPDERRLEHEIRHPARPARSADAGGGNLRRGRHHRRSAAAGGNRRRADGAAATKKCWLK